MSNRAEPQSYSEIQYYHIDALSALRLFFSPEQRPDPDFVSRYAGEPIKEIERILQSRLRETDLRSSLNLMAAIEAKFRIDYRFRANAKMPDSLSSRFRQLHKTSQESVRLEDILDCWKEEYSSYTRIIGELKGAFHFRHWLAHGRYFQSRNPKHDFASLSILAEAVFKLPFAG